MNKFLTFVDRFDAFLMERPWASLALATVGGIVYAVVLINVP